MRNLWRTEFLNDNNNANNNEKHVYPLPATAHALDPLSHLKYLLLIEFRYGYWQIELDERDRSKTACLVRSTLAAATVVWRQRRRKRASEDRKKTTEESVVKK